MESSRSALLLFSLVLLFQYSSGLECYACENQESNKDKCIKTTKQCEEQQQVCLTSIRWGLPPYWTPYGDRVHFVSKNCETKASCEEQKMDKMKYCKRDWFDDWECVECCTGDQCNRYVTLGAGTQTVSFTCLMVALLSAFLNQVL